MTKIITATIGLVEGYNNSSKPDFEAISQMLFQESQLYPFTWYFAKVGYNILWGCPVGGEDVAILSATANPYFVKDLESWEKEMVGFFVEIARKLKQSTCQITTHEGKFYYKKF
jgi:hypothetical protein